MIRRYVWSVFAVTCIPVAVTVVFMENHANVDVPRSTAEMRSMQSAGTSFLNFFIVFLSFFFSFLFFIYTSHRQRPVGNILIL